MAKDHGRRADDKRKVKSRKVEVADYNDESAKVLTENVFHDRRSPIGHGKRAN